MRSRFETFNALHQVKELLILPNAWDAKSAIVLQEAGFKAIGTSSAAVAASLGYDDGESMPFEEYIIIIKRIVARVDLPVTVDMEMGYGKTKEAIYGNLKKLIDVGVVGINLEDSLVTNGTRTPGKAETFAATISYLKEQLYADSKSLFINVRSDTYLLKTPDARSESARRAKLYAAAGADSLFLPMITNEDDIADAVSASKLPLNVMCIPGLPDFDRLRSLGVRRASMGPFMQIKTYQHTKQLADRVIGERNFNSILP